MTTLLSLPHINVIYKQIFSYCTLKDLKNVYHVSKDFQSLIKLYVEKYCQNFNYRDTVRLDNLFQKSIKNRTNIRGLDFKGCQWLEDETIIPLLVNNPQLSYLNLYNCNLITEETLFKISELCYLKYLTLSFCSNLLHKESFRTVCEKLHRLKYVCFDGSQNSISEENIKLLSLNNKNLLSINCSGLTANALNHIGENIHQLKELKTRCENIEDENIKIITTNNKNLKVLDLSQCLKISSVGFNDIGKNLCHLTKLNLDDCPDMNDQNIKNIVMNNKNLLDLSLSHCNSLTMEGFHFIGEYLVRLKRFSIKYCSGINDDNMKFITGNNKNLDCLDLTNCSSLTSVGFDSIAENLCFLKSFYLEDSHYFNDENVKNLTMNNKNIANLWICECLNVTSKGFYYIGEYIRNLEQFTVEKSSTIDDECMKFITENNKNIEDISLMDCPSLTKDSFKYISENLCGLSNFSLEELLAIDDEHIKNIVMNNKKLEILSLFDCPNISEECVIYLQDILPECSIHYA